MTTELAMDTQYSELDAKIVSAVKAGINEFYRLGAHLSLRNFRTLDRRLQALRKRGVLTYSHKTGWKSKG